MALYVKQDDNRTELQEKMAAELSEKQIKNSLGEGGFTPENKGKITQPEDSVYFEGTKETTGLAFIWLLVLVAVLVALGLYVWVAAQRV